jgi:hypothetical protein
VIALVGASVKVVGLVSVPALASPIRKVPVPRFAVNEASPEKSTFTALSLVPPVAPPSVKFAGLPEATTAPPPMPRRRVVDPFVSVPIRTFPLMVTVRPAATERSLNDVLLVRTVRPP